MIEAMSVRPKRPRAARTPRPKPPPKETPVPTPAQNQTYTAASMYLAAGLGMVPIAYGGSKRPSWLDLPVRCLPTGEPVLGDDGRPERTWKPFEGRLPTEDEVRQWFDRKNPAGIAIVGGAVSGNLELLDFDEDAAVIFPAWRDLVEAESPGLVARLNVVRTPRPGFHARYRCPGVTIPGNARLAQKPGPPDLNGKPTRVSLIETRGEGGYGLAPGTPGACHESGGTYTHFSGPKLSHVQDISPEERALLWRVARSFSRLPPEEPKPPRQARATKPRDVNGAPLPGEDYDLNGPDWLEILDGWEVAHESGEVRYLRRPGKADRGWSATVGRCRGEYGEDLLYNFSTNAHPLEPEQAYGKFRAYTLLHHDGDFKAAARELAKRGYGTRPQKPGPDRDDETPRSAATPKPAKKTKPRLLPRYQPFPLTALAEPLRSFTAETASALGCDPSFVALPALAATAACVGNSRVIKLKKGWSEPSVVWTVIVGDSGTLKTPAYTKAVRHLFSIQETLRGEYDVAHRTWAEQVRDYRARSRRAGGNRSRLGPPPGEPPYRQIVSSDITIEQLAAALEANPHGILVARDELAGWLGSFRQYKGRDGGSDLPNWLEIFRAGTINVDRKTGDQRHFFVRRAAVSITGSIQPRTLAKAFTEEFLESGGAARILPAMPPKKPKTWSALEIHVDTESAYHDLLDKMRSLGFRQVAGRANVPNVLKLNADAQALWIDFVNSWGIEQAQFEGEMAAVYSKLEAYAARFAMLYHIADHLRLGKDDLTPVGVEAVKAGIALSQWFAREAQRIYALLGESDEQRDARRLVEFIQSRGGRISVRALQRSHTHRYRDRGDAQAALDALVQAGMAKWSEPTESPQGGTRAWFLKLYPTPDTCSADGPEEGDENEELPDT
jgi:hypothetical protein